MVETRRKESQTGRFTLIFLAAPNDTDDAKQNNAPLLELTYNWPVENTESETYDSGRNFGHLAYEVDDIYQFCTDLQNKGITINRPPRDGYMAFIKSPDGVSIELLQRGDRQEPAEPWVSMPNTGSW